jgi:hypothetical protein
LLLALLWSSWQSWQNGQTFQANIEKFEQTPAYQARLKSLGGEVEMVHHLYIVTYALGLLPNSETCGAAGEGWSRRGVCAVLKELPRRTEAAQAAFDPKGNRRIYLNVWGLWDEMMGTEAANPEVTSALAGWVYWHELGHHFQQEQTGPTGPWFDPRRTHLSTLYKEVHADIFALVSLAQEPKATSKGITSLVQSVIRIRKKHADVDRDHATDEYLQCIAPQDFFTKEDAVLASKGLFETALKRKAAGDCFLEPAS